METKNSPFFSNTFQNTWKKHFISNKSIKEFKFIDGVDFYKSRFALFVNVGKNLTKGNNYAINNHKDFKNNTFIIYDVLPHLNEVKNNLPKEMGVLKSIQYPGYLINLNQFKNIDEYLLRTFSKNTRMKMRKFNKRLDACFNISTKMFFGNIDKQEYDDVFDAFMFLLQKRFTEKQIFNNNMQSYEWDFYKEVAYPLILEKKASLFVVYDEKTPIAITYNYHNEDTLIDAITVFDIDYSKFNMGYINNLKLLNWCFRNNIKTLDFSKGYFDYKKRMCTLEYDFEYHVIYDKASIRSRLTAFIYYYSLEFKAYLRSNKYDVKFHKLSYLLKNKNQTKPKDVIEMTKLDKLPDSKGLIKINIKEEPSYSALSKYINDFLYLSVKPYKEIEAYKTTNQNETYILSSNTLIQQLKFTE